MINVLPVNDLREHVEDTTCWCQPSVEWDLPEPLVVHNAADGREGIELAEEALSEVKR